MSQESTPLAIIGIGCLFPKAHGVKEYWSNIKNRVDAITDIPPSHWSAQDYYDQDPKRPDFTYARRGGFIPPIEFDPAEFGISPNTLEATDSAQLLGLVAAQAALRDAGYGPEKEFDRNRVSVILGVTGTLELVVPLGARLGHPIWRKALKDSGIEGELAEEVVERIKDSYVGWQENSFPGLLGNVVAGRIANRFNLGGTNCVVDAACASSLSAMHLAGMELATGRANMVVTGGVDCFNDIFMFMCFSKTPALSPSGDSKPFDSKADGTALGEGLGMVVLKRLADAERDGDRIYAVLKGIGSSSDGRGKAIYAPSSEGQTKALRKAYEVAGISPDTVELVEAHGTGTTVGDGVEVDALKEVYREAKKDGAWCALGSVKSQIGHTKAAAGSAGLIKAAMALYHKVLPPTIKVTEPIKQIASGESPFYLNTEKRPWLRGAHPRRAAVSALGFGGSNFHAILEEYRPAKVEADWSGEVQLVALSGNNVEELKAALQSWSADLAWDELRVKAMQSRASFAASAPCRLVFVIEKGKTDLKKLVSTAMGGKSNPLEGIYFGEGAPGKLGVLFPGQGSQYVGMGRDLACQFPQAQEVLEGFGASLAERIYPRPVFKEEAKQAQETALRATQVAQPALGAVSLGAFKVLSDFGVRPDAFAGHSYGELTALCASGRMTPEALNELSCLRGQLMAQGDGGRGGMLAVQAALADIERVIKEDGLKLVVANKNAPAQSVLSGLKEEVARAAESFTRRGIKNVSLPVSAAFHSPLVAGAEKPFYEVAEMVAFTASAIPVYANKTGKPYPAPQPAKLLASQLASPVEFVSLVENMHKDGVRTFLEVGPGGRMTSLAQSILAGREFSALAVDSSAGKRSGTVDLARALAQLAALGYSIDLPKWEGAEAGVRQLIGKKKPKLAVMLDGANYRSPRATKPAKAPVPKLATSGASQNSREPMHPSPTPTQLRPDAPAQAQPAVPASSSFLAESLRANQESMNALQKLQEQTAALHVRFLEGQETVQQAFQSLIEQQQRLISGTGGAPMPMPPAFPAASQVSEKPVQLWPAIVAQSEKSVSGAPKAAPAAMPAPTAAPKAAPAPAPAAPAGNIEKVLLAVVSEKTGYPSEMLNADMDMESDLGIDSIKRVEILSAIREKLPNAPLVKPEHLGTLRTLRQITEFLSAGTAAPASGAEVAGQSSISAMPSASASAGNVQEIQIVLLAVVSEKTGYPSEMLNADMDMESDLGIDSIKRVEILSAIREKLPNAPLVKPEHLGTLRTLRQITEFLSQGQARPMAASGSGGMNAADSTGPSERAQVCPDTPDYGQGGASGKVETVLLAVVSEKTGYPAEMLNADMDMESDLGIDSIKRVEILSAIREKLPNAPLVKPEHLGTLRTLRQITEFLSAGAKPAAEPSAVKLAAEPSVASSAVEPTAAKPAAQAPAPKAAPAAVSGGITRSILRAAALDFSSPRPRVKVDPSLPIWVAGDHSGLVAAFLAKGIKALGFAMEDIAALEPRELGGLVIVAPVKKEWDEASELFLKQAFKLAQSARKSLKGGVFATVSRLDGAFGLENAEGRDPASGGLAGLAKTAAHEWKDVSCKALDLAVDFADFSAVAEEVLVSGPVEAGIGRGGRKALRLEESPVSGSSEDPLSPGDLVVVTGGARGVTAETALALAKACRPTFLLLGRSPMPTAEPEWLASCSTEAEAKKALLAHSGDRALSPKQLGERYARLAADREIARNLARIEAAGSKVVYEPVDVRDERELARVLAQHGRVLGLIHGAGVLADKLITEKTAEQFDSVFDTKVVGLRHLLKLAGADLKVLVLFSSSTGRFGRTGQSDYAMANEVLNKVAQVEAQRRPDCRVVSINWGPWDGGMVTPSLKKLFESEGVGVIGLAAGAEYLVSELGSGGKDVEIVIGGGRKTELKTAFERTLSVADHPFLKSHVIGGRPVLPAAVMIEWLAHGALHENPGLCFAGFEGFRVYKGVRLSGSEPYRIKVACAKAAKANGLYEVAAELRGEGDALHAGAKVILASRLSPADAPKISLSTRPYAGGVERAYRDCLFHGEALRGITAVAGVSEEGIEVSARAAMPPRAWLAQPPRDSWISDPMALDCAFQAMILWSFEKFGAGSLPSYAASYRQFRQAFPADGVRIRARVVKSAPNLGAADVEFLDSKGVIVARLEGYDFTIDKSLNESFQRNVIGTGK